MNNTKKLKYLITGGAGFIGSALIRYIIKEQKQKVINIDKLTYAGCLESIESISSSPLYEFEKVDICNQSEIQRIFEDYKPDKVIHLAAESHVDRSIDSPSIFIETNILGTYSMLEVSSNYFDELQLTDKTKARNFIFHHVSTDEVFGDLGIKNEMFTETTPYAPSSPYAASKASSDHLVRAWGRTYNLPTVISNCSNNYGPFQFPEKLIPLIITSAVKGNPLPIYGDGLQIRDWLYVEDHAKALIMVANQGRKGETYNIGGNNEHNNLFVVDLICSILDEKLPNHPNGIQKYNELINYVKDRPGHDLHYAIDASKISTELGWSPEETFASGIEKTITWYLENSDWLVNLNSKKY